MENNNLNNIKSSLHKTNKKNLAIQSFIMLGFVGTLGVTFNTTWGFIPGLMFGANIPIFLMELNSRKALKASDKEEMTLYSLFSRNFRYSKNLKKDFSEYIENSTTETEKKYKTFYLNLWALFKSPYEIHSKSYKFKDYFLFQAISKNIKLYKEVYKNDDIKNTPLEFEDKQEDLNHNFFNSEKINDFPFHDENFLNEMIAEYHQMQGDDKKRIDSVIQDFQEFGLLGEAFIHLFVESFNLRLKTDAHKYLGPKKVFLNKLKKNSWTKDLNFLETMLELQNFKFNDADRATLNKFLTTTLCPKFIENSQRSFSSKSIDRQKLIKIFKENTKEDAELLMTLNQLFNLQVRDKNLLLNNEDSRIIFEKELLSKQLNQTEVPKEVKKRERPVKI